jgi:hypothetical protein
MVSTGSRDRAGSGFDIKLFLYLHDVLRLHRLVVKAFLAHPSILAIKAPLDTILGPVYLVFDSENEIGPGE